MLFAVLTAVIVVQKTAQAADSDFVIEDGVLTRYNGSGSDVVIPNGVTEIGESSFADCIGLKSITLPDGVTKIGRYAFEGCTSLTNIIIPSSVTEIENDAFASIFYGVPDTPWLVSKRKERADHLVIINNMLVDGKEASGDVVIPNGVTTICADAFCFNGSLTSVIIPDGVKEISSAFSYCESLINITIPNSVTKIDEYAFMQTGIQKIAFPASVKEVASWALADCFDLMEITILNPQTKLWADNNISCNIVSQGPRGRTSDESVDSVSANESVGSVGSDGTATIPDSSENPTENGHPLIIKGYKGSTAEELTNYLMEDKEYYMYIYKTIEFVALDETGDSNVTTKPNNPSKPNVTTKPDKTSSAKAKALLKKVKVTKNLSIKRKKSKTIKVTLPKGLKKVTKYTNKSGQVKITYKSNKKKTATVNAKGKVTAKRKGTAKIITTVKVKDGTKKTFTTKVKVK